jgi:hypothetical protein
MYLKTVVKAVEILTVSTKYYWMFEDLKRLFMPFSKITRVKLCFTSSESGELILAQ